MQRSENECVQCGFPCKGNDCPNRNVRRYYCDHCGDETDLYEFCGEELCIDCIIKQLPKVNDY